MTDNIKDSQGVNWGCGVNRSYGVNVSNGVNLSDGVHWSNGVNRSNGVNWCDGVNLSDGVDWSYGVNRSNGVNGSYGVSRSYGIFNSYGVDGAIFLADKKRTYSIFGKEVSEERFNKVWDELINKLHGWFPKFNTAYLWLKKEGSWEKVYASKIESTLENWEKPYEAWKDMPQEAVDYVSSLPEFDAKMLLRITGIDVGVSKNDIKKQELLDKAQELLDKAKELQDKAKEL